FNISKNGGSIMEWKAYKKAVPAVIVILALVLVGMSGIFAPISIANASELGPNTVQGKVLSIQTNAWRRGTMEVKSDHTGRIYTFYLGSRTDYHPYRYPYIGERVRVRYLNDRGYLKATRVEIL
ncbi:MAG: DUF3592 domain-containing protein, partial [Desulfobacterales bacterium]|nr:DUF3592 domain-containing protein [Desulfobacterales bacterium]